MIKIEFDKNKSQANLEKHGIDFIEAQRLWDDADLLEIAGKTIDEPRSLVIGVIAGIRWSGVITYRGNSIRIISVRRSRKEEVFFMKAKAFEDAFDKGDDILDMLDLSKARRSRQDQKRVNVDFPVWMIGLLDKEASRLGVTRQSIIKVWLAERLEALASNKI